MKRYFGTSFSIASTLLLIVAAVLFKSSPASAAGHYLPGRGVRALGFGGAFIAGANDPSAMWYNPANLAALKGTQAMIDMSLIFLNADFHRAGFNEIVSNEAPPHARPLDLRHQRFRPQAFHLRLRGIRPLCRPDHHEI